MKKINKKYIYIGLGLIIFILMAAGVGFWLWNRSKSSDIDSEEDISEEQLPTEIKEWRKQDWVDKKSGLSTYLIPDLPKNLSASRAKDELLEAFWQWSSKIWDKKRIARTLEKNAQRINLTDKKEKDEDPLFEVKYLEELSKKYSQDIFLTPPNQEKFEESISEIIMDLFFLRSNFRLKYKGNKRIDWLASLREYTKKTEPRTKAQEEEYFEKVTSYLEREINPSIIEQVNKFPSCNNLTQLNQWTNTLACKEAMAKRIVYSRWFVAQRIKKNVPNFKETKSLRYVNIKNEKFNLEPVVTIYKAR